MLFRSVLGLCRVTNPPSEDSGKDGGGGDSWSCSKLLAALLYCPLGNSLLNSEFKKNGDARDGNRQTSNKMI